MQNIKSILFLLVTGCWLLVTSHAVAGPSYRSTLNKWTKTDRIYSLENLDAQLVWHATMLSDEMLAAQEREEARRLKTVASNQLPVVSEHQAFFVSLYTTKELKGFSLDDSSVWKILLVDANGSEVSPTKIEPVTITPTERVFYPYLDRWSKAYRVEFPPAELGKKPQLVLRSIVAESRLKWRLKQTLNI